MQSRPPQLERPVFLIGHGARGADFSAILGLNVPVLTSWQAKDLIDNHHPSYFGCPGIYGNRAANKILHDADKIIAVGNRMSIWNVGYEGPRPDQDVLMVDVDEAEVLKFPNAQWRWQDAKDFIEAFRGTKPKDGEWIRRCRAWAVEHPWLEFPTHEDTKYINAYRFTAGLQKYLREDEVIVTDMGTALICAHQVLRLKPPQRLMTSGGLGEMGCALPAAVGASFARNRGEVLCLNTDGGMMLNLQELQTIVHHKLPIKIIVYRNEGYLMIKHTQKNARMQEYGVDPVSGVSFPKYHQLAYSLGMYAATVRTWEDYSTAIPAMFAHKGPCLIEYHMAPDQPLVPKLDPIFVDGKPTSPPFWKMSPDVY